MVSKIQGSESPDQWIIRGNHHDGWVNGAENTISGQIALLEEARALGELLKQGWKPKRTIVYCAWDGEEPMLLGSTEWAEYHGDELKQHAALYINTDGNGRGFLAVEGSHSLEKFVNTVARDINDPEKNISVWKRGQAARLTWAVRKTGKTRARVPIFVSPRSVPAATTPLFSTISASRRSTSPSPARMTAASITRSTMIFTGSPIFR